MSPNPGNSAFKSLDRVDLEYFFFFFGVFLKSSALIAWYCRRLVFRVTIPSPVYRNNHPNKSYVFESCFLCARTD